MLVNNMLCETLDPSNKMSDLYHHVKHMSHERQQRVIKNFDSYNKVEKKQPSQPNAAHFGPSRAILKLTHNFSR